MSTIHERVAAARQTLGHAGIGSVEAEVSARILAEHVLGWDATRYFTSANEPEPPDFAERYDALVARRGAREPAAYITGRQEFWGLSFEVGPAVLIPRPSTELIVEAALEAFGADRSRPIAVADACTGCGCLAVALAHELSRASVVATDISDTALDVARRNAERHGVADRIRFVHANVLDGIDTSQSPLREHEGTGVAMWRGPLGLRSTFDLIVANPPYVRQGDRPGLQPEVRDYEPPAALFGGESGIELVATVVEQAAARLRAGGYLMVEFGFGQEMVAEELIEQAPGLTMVGLRRDLLGLARIAIAKRALT